MAEKKKPKKGVALDGKRAIEIALANEKVLREVTKKKGKDRENRD